MRALSAAAVATPASGIREIVNAVIGRENVTRLEIGQPSFEPPAHILEAAFKTAASSGGYTASAGNLSLRRAIVDKLGIVNGLSVSPDEVTVTVGAMGGIFLTLMTVCDAGDEVLVPDVAWPNYQMAARSLGIRCVPYAAGPQFGFLPQVRSISDAAAATATAIIVNSPSNPAGTVLPREDMNELLAFASRHDLWVVSDETYDQLTFDAEHVSPMASDRDGRVISIFSFSKTYAIPGWRIGYVVAPPPVTSIIQKLTEATVSCAPSIAQRAAEAALNGPQDCVSEMRDTYRARRDAALEILRSRGLSSYVPQGAFYLMVDIAATGMHSRDFALALLSEANVAVAPGRAFGDLADGFVRICFAAPDVAVRVGMAKLADFIVTHRAIPSEAIQPG